MRRYWKKGGGWRFRRASQVRTGRGRLDVALDRAEAVSDEVCQVLILGLPGGPLLAGIDIAPDHFGFAQAAILRRIAQNIRRIRAQAHALARPLAPFFSRDF